MCGLVGLISKRDKPVAHQVWELYKKQASRGRNGYGYLTFDMDFNVSIKRFLKEDELKKSLLGESSRIILFHHRMPTSTPNTLGTTHPIFVSNDELEYDYLFAHNGVISNADTLKSRHNKLGYKYVTEYQVLTKFFYHHNHIDGSCAQSEITNIADGKFNDSESLAVELARYLEGKSSEVDTRGAVAFWGVRLSKGTKRADKIFYGKNRGRDLCVITNKKHWGISSETGTELDHMKLFTINLDGDFEHTEEKLKMSDYIKTTTTPGQTRYIGYGNGAYEHDTKSFRDRLAEVENKEYTYTEAIDTGLPLSEFFTMDKPGGSRVWIPCKYSGMEKYRKTIPALPLPPGDSLNGESVPSPFQIAPKIQDLVEKLYTKLVELEFQRDGLETMRQSYEISQETYKKTMSRVESDIQEIEEKIAAYNLPEDYTDEVYQLCYDLHDYNNSYCLSPEEVEYIIES